MRIKWGIQVSEHDIIALSELNPNITLPWIIDEFDASFNKLAQATRTVPTG